MNAYEIYLDGVRRELIEPLSEIIVFDKGLTTEELNGIEAFWGIHFPKSLADFFRCAFPVREKNPVVYPWQTAWEFEPFPDWRDFSEKNVNHIREWMEAPVKNLVHDMKRDGWECDNWVGLTPEDVADAAPKLIPVYGGRFLPMCGWNPPVFSCAGRDVVYYGADLREYLRREWMNETPEKRCMPYVPVWGDIPRQYWEKQENPFTVEQFLRVFTEQPQLLHESGFRFASDPISPKQTGYVRERMIGWMDGQEKPYWIGGCDIPNGTEFFTAEELLDAPVFAGKSMRERWDEVIWLELIGLDPVEWMRMYV
ncbi:MAG: hypothetical protein IJ497_06835 [Clostridia bacterium]|nr:hypothetical protein [Clostridia bacterium]